MLSAATLALLLGVLLLAWASVRHYRIAALLPGPFSLPLLGNLLHYITVGNKHVVLLHKWQEYYGNIYHVFIPGAPSAMRLIFSSDPKILKHWLSTAFNKGVYMKGEFFHDMYLDFLGAGIFNVNGDEWRRQRAKASQLFQLSRLRQHLEVFREQSMVVVSHLESRLEKAADADGSIEVDMQDLFMCYTLDSFAQIGFGVQLDTITNGSSQFQAAFDYVQTKTEARGRLGNFWKVLDVLWRDKRYYEDLSYMNEFVRAIIAERRKESVEKLRGREDLLSILLVEEREDDGNGKRVSMGDGELRDFVMNFMLAGRDTTAMLLTWCTYLIGKHPHVQERIREEMANVLPGGDIQSVDWNRMKQLAYLKQVLQETLRLYPPVPMDGFQAVCDDELPGGHPVQKGDQLLYSAYAMHRSAELFPDPHSFRPERFENPPEPYTFLPFHGGPRVCLGQEMAYVEAKLMICTLLQHFEVVAEREVDIKAAIILTAEGGMPIRLRRRQHSVK